MPNQQHLRDLESQLYWCQYWYLLRVWQDCGSFNSADDFDRLQIAEEMRAHAEGQSKQWALAGLTNLLDHLLLKLDDPDPEIRQDAAIALGDYSPKDHAAINALIERLQQPDQTFHDRTCSAWALGQIGAKAGEVVPILVALIDELKDQPLADEFRRFAAKAIEKLTGGLERV